MSANERNVCLIIIAAFFALYCVNAYDFLSARAHEREMWIFGAWQTNFSGGFTRRGLIGEIIEVFDLEDQRENILLFQTFIYILIFALAAGVCLINKSDGLLLICVALFSPFGISYYVSQPWALGRGESFFFVALLLFSIFYQIKKDGRLLYLLSFLLFLVSFFHENFFFYLGPLFAVVAILVNRRKINFVQALAPFGVSLVMMLAMTFLSEKNIADDICQSLGQYAYEGCSEVGPIAYLDTDLWYSFHNVRHTVINQEAVKVYSVGAVLVFIPLLLLIFLHTRINANFREISIFASGFLFSLPLFLVANDWGRWQHALFITGVVSLLMLREEKRPNFEDQPDSKRLERRILWGLLIGFMFFGFIVSIPVMGNVFNYGYGVRIGYHVVLILNEFALNFFWGGGV